MMNARLSKALVALLAVAAVGACDEAPIDPGSSDADRLATNPSFAVIEAAETRLIQAYLVNSVGNPVAGDVDFEACNGIITAVEDPDQLSIEPGQNILVTGVTLGESCVTTSSGSFEETISIRVVPAALAVTSLTPGDSVRAGETGSIDVTAVDADGNPVGPFSEDEITYTSGRPGRLFFTDESGAFDTDSSGAAIVTASYELFGVAREIEIPITVLPQVPATGRFQTTETATTAATVFPALEAGDTSSLFVVLRDTLGNINNLDMDINGITVVSSNPSAVTAWGEITTDPQTPGSVDIRVYAQALTGGESNITATVHTAGGDIPIALARAVVLAPHLTAITPNNGVPGEPLVISGNGLAAVGFTTEVYLGTTNITRWINSATASAVTIGAPAFTANGTSGQITVRVGGVSSDNSVTYTQNDEVDFWSPANEDIPTAPIMVNRRVAGSLEAGNIEDFHKFTITTAGNYTITVDWLGGKDLDIIVATESFSAFACADAGRTANHPEVVANCALTPGTYLLYIQDYSQDHDGDTSTVGYAATVTP